MYDDPPSRTFIVKLVGRREGEKAKVKRETAAKFVCQQVALCDVTRHSLANCLQDLAVKKAMIQQAYNFCCKQFHRFNLLGEHVWSRLIRDHNCLVQSFEVFFPTLHSLLFWCYWYMHPLKDFSFQKRFWKWSVVKPVDHPSIFD